MCPQQEVHVCDFGLSRHTQVTLLGTEPTKRAGKQNILSFSLICDWLEGAEEGLTGRR